MMRRRKWDDCTLSFFVNDNVFINLANIFVSLIGEGRFVSAFGSKHHLKIFIHVNVVKS